MHSGYPGNPSRHGGGHTSFVHFTHIPLCALYPPLQINVNEHVLA
jgi:hypothetical protein